MIPLNGKNDLHVWLLPPLGEQEPWTGGSPALQDDEGEREYDLPLNFFCQANLLSDFDLNFLVDWDEPDFIQRWIS